jgi:hypothetical protein
VAEYRPKPNFVQPTGRVENQSHGPASAAHAGQAAAAVRPNRRTDLPRRPGRCRETGCMEALEPGLLTLAKIVGTLVVSIGIIPLVFLMVEGDRTEPGGYVDKK